MFNTWSKCVQREKSKNKIKIQTFILNLTLLK